MRPSARIAAWGASARDRHHIQKMHHDEWPLNFVLRRPLTWFFCILVRPYSNMKAIPLIRRRIILSVNAFAEVAVWRVPEPVPPSEHAFQYRLAYLVKGQCVVRYDNERGKGDHRHFGAEEFSYIFSTPEQLMVDFNLDSVRWNHEYSHP